MLTPHIILSYYKRKDIQQAIVDADDGQYHKYRDHLGLGNDDDAAEGRQD